MNRWLPVVGGVCMNLALGTLYAWSVFVLPLEREFGWSRAETSWTFTIAVVTFAASFILAGRIQDLRGPRICAAIGGTLVGLGFVLSSFTTSLWHLYVMFGVVVGLGNGFGYATPMPVASKWFPDKRGLVVGLMVGGYGAGSAIFGPVATALIGSLGWRPTFQILGALFFGMCMIGAWLLKNPPPGYQPPGWTPAQSSAAAQRGARDYSPSEMLKTPTFVALWIAYCLGTTAGLMIISQLVPFARAAGLSAAAATFAITIGAVGNAGGRILSGWLSDTLGRLTTLRVMVLLSAVAMPTLFVLREEVLLFYVLAMVVYWCYGTQLSVFASTTADFYGTRNLGTNYGLLFSAWGVAGVIGPMIGAQVFDAFGDYRYAFYTAGALAVVAFGSLALARSPGLATRG
ncbi:MAG: MFS transporter [Acidobacteria bacterium]|nr:MFS transporter [Acidobacteriota bacterium]